MAELLNDERIDEALVNLSDWQRKGDALERTAQLADFPQAIQVVNRVAEIAESENHHPDIDIRWRNLTFRLSTHSDGGITQKDVTLAGEIDEVINSV
ncbi:4a-hydroxytetrahydrobiopterin dehydratase [Qaidamihabitans albus]|uniref:4a-hydroxytetrahydrobiopterin dehydratase n=1 Tax=Qaidamihabitans albus TaxID=2795733 RepID=UPI0018F1A030|nr:4a-hydroxytetrahydrobiopterin dehydratase [Qaidamihabitans albus]